MPVKEVKLDNVHVNISISENTFDIMIQCLKVEKDCETVLRNNIRDIDKTVSSYDYEPLEGFYVTEMNLYVNLIEGEISTIKNHTGGNTEKAILDIIKALKTFDNDISEKKESEALQEFELLEGISIDECECSYIDTCKKCS